METCRVSSRTFSSSSLLFFSFPFSLLALAFPSPFSELYSFYRPAFRTVSLSFLGGSSSLNFFYNLSLLGYGLFVSATSSRSGFLFFLCFNSLFFPFQFIRVGEDPR